MEISEEVFWIQKAGCSAQEYEDAFFPTEPSGARAESFRFAIADGATESSFSGVWARILVRSFVSSAQDADLLALVAESQPQWIEEVGKRNLPWYAAAKAQDGAFAAFLGVALSNNSASLIPSRWKAQAVGDACLVQVRGEQVVVRFPLDQSSAFGSSPFLLSSNPERNERVASHLRCTEGECQPGDALYLMTDALACWFMAEDEQGRAPWRILRDLNTTDQAEPFDALIGRLRSEGRLHNDDTTLMRIDIL